jgi:hypothetical protein
VLRNSLVFIACTTALACASSGGGAPVADVPPDVSTIGTYEVTATLPGSHVKGMLSITADSMSFRSDNNCETRYSTAGSREVARSQSMRNSVGKNRMTFGCDGALLAFDKNNPTQSATWHATISVPKQRTVCSNYVTRNGVRVCESTSVETYDVAENRSGPIQVRRIP